ncbi:MAG TPA: hypothetical protein VMB50_08505 [Myxococcales bacterium]|nr:hypothetical protein [Myxococcales bacterium]
MTLPRSCKRHTTLLAGLVVMLAAASSQAMVTHEVRAAHHTAYSPLLPKVCEARLRSFSPVLSDFRAPRPVLVARAEVHPRAGVRPILLPFPRHAFHERARVSIRLAAKLKR